MNRTYATDTPKLRGEKVRVKGWVHSRRDHGGLIFIDLRDHTGIVQLTINAESIGFKNAESLRDEYVIDATGNVAERAKELVNPNIATGEIEIMVEELAILNKSEPLPILVNSTQHISEDNRLKYRYLDLRREKMQYMLKKRAELYAWMRRYMDSHEFTEVTTPILANSSPEGARDFLIPARLHPGKFYALPQAPQQFKQLLMVGGMHRYYQIAGCFRDEDPRADRCYGEFYQLDMEMSFVDDGEEVRTTIEPLIIDLVKNFAGKTLLFDAVPRIPYLEAMERFGSDKPDLRFGMELIDLTETLKDCGFGVFTNAIKAGGAVKAIAVPKQFSRSEIDKLTELVKRDGAGGLPYMTVESGVATSSIAKFFNSDELTAIVAQTGAKDGDTIFFGSDVRAKVNKVLGGLRSHLGGELGMKDSNVVALAWIVDFPFYEWDDKANKLDFGHNPFSMPKGGLDALNDDDKLAILADQYDMVMNGYEICSGGVRNHNPEVLYKVFGVLGFDADYVEQKFGGMLNAFKFGAPPHAGCAFGIDRMFMELMSEENIREVVAFPKNGSGMDVMMNSPSPIDDAQLRELSIQVKLPS
ncbi:MAG TPA: aspartate--tRNA ligase [Candidatus Saccharibacteria bacterium]|nr:aspartate--tRNA ligase [Candidatus Saccharibacteria bacterium]